MISFKRTIPVINALNGFALNILQKQLQLNDAVNDNILISPLSIYLALSMVYNGSANTTKTAIGKTLQLDDKSATQLNEICKQLIEQLPAEDNEVTIAIANAIWYNKKLHPQSSFITTNKTFFHAGIEHLTNAEVINTWVTNNTSGKIRNIINTVNDDMLMLLVNAVYFNAKWQQPFKPYNTYTNKFYLQNGDVADKKFMSQYITARHYIDEGFRIVELPYGNGESFSLYVIDGNNKTGITALVANLNEGILKKQIANMRSAKIDLSLPAWESDYSINDMTELLSSLGMGIAFTVNADFTGMYTEPAFISSAIHKTYIKVAEEGTTAAALTAFAVASGPPPSVHPPVVMFNRPFLYIIVAKNTGAMLFTGVVNNPGLKD